MTGPLRSAAALVLAAAAAALFGCSTVVYVRKPESRIFMDATYETTRPYFFWGLVGEDVHVHVDRICLGKDADQVSSEYTPGNVLVSVLTLGIYIPRTVKVWCQI